MLTAEQAVQVVRRHGLTLADAASLRALADDVESAERIAADFTAPDRAEKEATRQLADRLFSAHDDRDPFDPYESFRSQP